MSGKSRILLCRIGPGNPPFALDMRLLERTFRVEVPLSRAWEQLARLEDWPQWALHIRSVERSPAGKLTEMTSGEIRLKNGIRSTFRMTELREGRSWKWSGPFLWLRVDYDHQFRELDPSRTELTFLVEATGFAVGVFGRLFAAIYARNLDRAIPRLIRTLEGESAADTPNE